MTQERPETQVPAGTAAAGAGGGQPADPAVKAADLTESLRNTAEGHAGRNRQAESAAGQPAGRSRQAESTASQPAARAGQAENTASQPAQERLVRRMNANLNEILGSEVTKTAASQRTQSQMKALKRERRRRRVSVPLILLCVLALLAGGGYGGYQYLKKSGRESLLEHTQAEGVEITVPEDAELIDDGETVIYQGKTYKRNNDIVSILALGVDEKSASPEEHAIGESGQADTIFIAALDTYSGELTLINISRDSIVDVDQYSEDGVWVGTESMQVCLAYAYGDGGKTSCENTIKSVSRLMYGMPIDAYGSITVPAISVLNDALGGVEVTALDDIGSRDGDIKKGQTVTLTGEQVRSYVISRDLYDETANNARMARQRQYLIAFVNKALSRIRSNPGTVFTLYDAVRSYMTTDLTPAKLTYLASLVMNGQFREQDIRTVPGEITVETGIDGEQHAAYHVNDKELYQIILDVYYTEVS